MGATYSQFFPPKPSLTEANLQSQEDKVFIVTGGYSGVGFELCRILYQAGGKVYMAGRSEAKAEDAISKIKASETTSTGKLVFLRLSLDDLTTIKPAVETFTSSESNLNVLFNNAGVSNPPKGSVSAQGHELQMATNCLGHHLLTQLLLPALRKAARNVNSATVRVIWLSSIAVDLSAPKTGMNLSDLENPPSNQQHNYVNSKIGNWFLASSLATQVGPEGILSVTVNPGNLETGLLRHIPRIVGIVTAPLLYDAKMGAYTELWAGFTGDLQIDDGGKYLVPWGRLHPNPRSELLAAMKAKEEGGTGVAAAFVEYCDKQTADFQ
ncbi:putative steroid dehydrogenase [Viridothelium virens]|uniref:Putative steroid dehydrogenase n=1 Tax=Viridothelium virens TaxID=1048519 RepID=A0A6A6GRV5_VIRVR|nr:putative steroid dehydrogenase [Viridothelium virens]